MLGTSIKGRRGWGLVRCGDNARDHLWKEGLGTGLMWIVV